MELPLGRNDCETPRPFARFRQLGRLPRRIDPIDFQWPSTRLARLLIYGVDHTLGCFNSDVFELCVSRGHDVFRCLKLFFNSSTFMADACWSLKFGSLMKLLRKHGLSFFGQGECAIRQSGKKSRVTWTL